MADNQENSNALEAEITSLRETLCALDKNETPQVSISDHARRISSLLSMGPCEGYFPIHHLLCVKPLTNTEIPLDILEMLVSHFDVNEKDYGGNTCLIIAIENEHYNAVRYLARHAADCNRMVARRFGEDEYCVTPLSLLVSKSNAPLDITDLLKADETLNVDPYAQGSWNSPVHIDPQFVWNSPLSVAISCGNFQSALHLIELGANANESDREHYLEYYAREKPACQFDSELFEKLVPSGSADILHSIARTIKLLNLYCWKHEESDYETKFKLICPLVQRLKEADPLPITIANPIDGNWHRIYMKINDSEDIQPALAAHSSSLFSTQHYFKCMYLMSLLLSHLDWNIALQQETIAAHLHSSATQQDKIHARAIDEIWNKYNQPKVRSLSTLCVQLIRKHLNSLSDSSFKSLPVPDLIQNPLMYRDVADVVCEAWCRWPQCSLTHK